jgi:hypothetical protein
MAIFTAEKAGTPGCHDVITARLPRPEFGTNAKDEDASYNG